VGKVAALLITLVICAVSLPAQATLHNAGMVGFALSTGGLNFGLEYERLLGEHFSAGAGISTQRTEASFMDFHYAEAFARFYPGRKDSFFLKLGMGAYRLSFSSRLLYILSDASAEDVTNGSIMLPLISTGMGWKIDTGRRSSWFLFPNFNARIIILASLPNPVIPIGALFEVGLKVGYRF